MVQMGFFFLIVRPLHHESRKLDEAMADRAEERGDFGIGRIELQVLIILIFCIHC
jgi:hypothetical protein